MPDHSTKRYRIKDLSEITEVSRRAVRYYVQRGLLAAPLGAGRGSYYTHEHLQQLLALKEAQEKGYSLEEIEEFHVLNPSSLSKEEAKTEAPDLSSKSSTSLPSSLNPSPSYPSLPLTSSPVSPAVSPATSKPPPLDDSDSISTWLRLKVNEELELHLKEGALSSTELESLRLHIQDFFSKKHSK
jgi:DNA-binding transcriptional MerR regulator